MTVPSKAAEVRRILLDPLYRGQSLRAIARYAGCSRRYIRKIEADLIRSGLVPPRPVNPIYAEARKARELEAVIVAALLAPDAPHRTIGEIAAELDVSPTSVRRVYRVLAAEGRIARRTGGTPRGRSTKDRPPVAPRRRIPWSRVSPQSLSTESD